MRVFVSGRGLFRLHEHQHAHEHDSLDKPRLCIQGPRAGAGTAQYWQEESVGRDGQCVSERQAYGRSWHRTVRHVAVRHVAVAVLLLACSAATAPAAPPKAEAKATKTPPVDLMPAIEQIADAQRALAASVAQLRQQLSEQLADQLTQTQRAISELRDQTREKHEASQQVLDQVLDQVEGMRKEVWGLYVESSGLKNDIAQTGKQVEGLDQDLGNFRLSAGIVVAIVVVLQFVLVGLAFRGRG